MTTLKQKWTLWRRVYKYNHPLYKEWLYIKDRLNAWWKARQLRKTIKLANARAKAENKRIYVLPDDNNIPRSFSTKEIELLKRHKLMSRKATCVDLFRESIYVANPPKQ